MRKPLRTPRSAWGAEPGRGDKGRPCFGKFLGERLSPRARGGSWVGVGEPGGATPAAVAPERPRGPPKKGKSRRGSAFDRSESETDPVPAHPGRLTCHILLLLAEVVRVVGSGTFAVWLQTVSPPSGGNHECEGEKLCPGVRHTPRLRGTGAIEGHLARGGAGDCVPSSWGAGIRSAPVCTARKALLPANVPCPRLRNYPTPCFLPCGLQR